LDQNICKAKFCLDFQPRIIRVTGAKKAGVKKRGRPRDSGRAAIEEEEEVNCLSDTSGANALNFDSFRTKRTPKILQLFLAVQFVN
jgi:hypothetical protein